MMPDKSIYITALIVFLSGLGATLLFTPMVGHLAVRLGVMDKGGYRKINQHNIPLLGGMAIALPFLGACLWGHFSGWTLPGASHSDLTGCLVLLIGAGAMIGLGLRDDTKGLDARNKFLVQIMVAVLVWASGYAINDISLPLAGTFHLSPALSFLLTLFWIVGVTNACNLLDGMDGLATGVTLIACLGLVTVAFLHGAIFAALLGLVLAGSLLAFLCYNFHPARIFLGDTGSLFIGFTLATLALAGCGKPVAGGLQFGLTPLLLLGVPIFDTLTSMLRRILRGRSPFFGDRAHTHHRLLDYGLSQRQAALSLYGAGLICAALAIGYEAAGHSHWGRVGALGAYLLLVGTLAGVNGYLRPGQILRVLRCRRRNTKLAAFIKYANQVMNNDSNSGANVEDLLRLGCRDLNLRFLEIGYAETPEIKTTIDLSLPGGKAVSGDPIETIRVCDANARLLILRYQLNHTKQDGGHLSEHLRETDKLEHQDVTACLAYLFGSVKGHFTLKRKLTPSQSRQPDLVTAQD